MTLQEAVEKHGQLFERDFQPGYVDSRGVGVDEIKADAEIIITAPTAEGIDIDAEIGDKIMFNGREMTLDHFKYVAPNPDFYGQERKVYQACLRQGYIELTRFGY